MFIEVGKAIDDLLTNYLSAVLVDVGEWVAALAAIMLTLYVLIYGLAIVRGEVAEPIKDFAWKVVKLGLILVIASGAGSYTDYVISISNAATVEMVNAFIPETTSGPASPAPTSIWSSLNDFNTRASDLVLMAILEDRGEYVPDLMPWAAAILFSIGNCTLIIIAFLVTLYAKVLQQFVLAIGPLFILSLMWRPTARFFDAWLGMLLSTIVLVWLTYFILGFSVGTSSFIIERYVTEWDATNLVANALTYVVIFVAFAFILYQAPALASSLTGGGPSQFGTGVVRQAKELLQIGRGGGAGGNNLSNPSTGGSAQRGAGAAYHAGRLTGAGLRQAGDGARAVAQGVGSATKYAYQRAAALGRRMTNR